MIKPLSLTLPLLGGIFLISLVSLNAKDPLTLSLSQLDVRKKDAASYTVEFSATCSASLASLTESLDVPLLDEEYVIYGPSEGNLLREEDILFSQKQVDLNGDGDVKDSFRLNRKPDGLYLEKQLMEPIVFPHRFAHLTGYQYSRGKDERICRLNPGGETFALYSLPDSQGNMVMAFGTKEHPLKILYLPNPHVQLMVIKARDDTARPGWSLAGHEKRVTFTNREILPEQGDRWAAAVWSALPLKISEEEKNDFSVIISGITPPFTVLARINMSFDRGIRLE
jgi:hypothetical protein